MSSNLGLEEEPPEIRTCSDESDFSDVDGESAGPGPDPAQTLRRRRQDREGLEEVGDEEEDVEEDIPEEELDSLLEDRSIKVTFRIDANPLVDKIKKKGGATNEFQQELAEAVRNGLQALAKDLAVPAHRFSKLDVRRDEAKQGGVFLIAFTIGEGAKKSDKSPQACVDQIKAMMGLGESNPGDVDTDNDSASTTTLKADAEEKLEDVAPQKKSKSKSGKKKSKKGKGKQDEDLDSMLAEFKAEDAKAAGPATSSQKGSSKFLKSGFGKMLDTTFFLANDKKSASGGWSLRSLLKAIGVILFFFLLVKLKAAGEANNIEGMDLKPPSVNLYDALNVKPSATSAQIQRAFRKAALKWHPDKNPNCEECVQKFREASEAYRVLSNPEQRKVYDQIDTSYTTLRSHAVELDEENFEELVTSGLHPLWVIQIYTDWHRSCIDFSTLWEDVVEEYGQHVQFGRLHLKRQEALVRTLPVAFGVVPTVFTFREGEFGKAIALYGSGIQSMNALKQLIHDEYPTVVEIIPPDVTSVVNFLARKGRSKYVLFSTRGGRPALTYLASAYAMQSLAECAMVSVPRSAASSFFEALALSKSVPDPHSTSIPNALISIHNKSSSQVDVMWTQSKITGGREASSSLMSSMQEVLQLDVYKLDDISFARQCQGKSPLTCVVLAGKCNGVAVPQSDLDAYVRAAAEIIRTRERSTPRRILFGYTLASQQELNKHICPTTSDEGSVIVGVVDAGQRTSHLRIPQGGAAKSVQGTITSWMQSDEFTGDTRELEPFRPSIPGQAYVIAGFKLRTRTVHMAAIVAAALAFFPMLYRLIPDMSSETKVSVLSLLFALVFAIEYYAQNANLS